MTWVFVAAAAVVVVFVAYYTVTIVSARLADTEAVATYDLRAATEFVCAGLSGQTAERTGADMVALLLAWNLDHLRRRGVAAFGEVDIRAAGRGAEPTAAAPDEALDELLRRAAAEGIELDALDAVMILEINAQYLSAIGAIGEQAGEV